MHQHSSKNIQTPDSTQTTSHYLINLKSNINQTIIKNPILKSINILTQIITKSNQKYTNSDQHINQHNQVCIRQHKNIVNKQDTNINMIGVREMNKKKKYENNNVIRKQKCGSYNMIRLRRKRFGWEKQLNNNNDDTQQSKSQSNEQTKQVVMQNVQNNKEQQNIGLGQQSIKLVNIKQKKTKIISSSIESFQKNQKYIHISNPFSINQQMQDKNHSQPKNSQYALLHIQKILANKLKSLVITNNQSNTPKNQLIKQNKTINANPMNIKTKQIQKNQLSTTTDNLQNKDIKELLYINNINGNKTTYSNFNTLQKQTRNRFNKLCEQRRRRIELDLQRSEKKKNLMRQIENLRIQNSIKNISAKQQNQILKLDNKNVKNNIKQQIDQNNKKNQIQQKQLKYATNITKQYPQNVLQKQNLVKHSQKNLNSSQCFQTIKSQKPFQQTNPRIIITEQIKTRIKFIKPKHTKKLQYNMNSFIQPQTFKKTSIQNHIFMQQQLKSMLRSQAITLLNQGSILCEVNGIQQRQIASLTKIMTCILSIYLIKKYDIDMQMIIIKVTRKATKLGGTSAGLKIGDKISIQNLLYGMMLPSGNDSAFMLAQYFGKYIYLQSNNLKQVQQQKQQQQLRNQSRILPSYLSYQHQNIDIVKKEGYSQYFIKQMNKFATFLNLKNTYFSNPHGLPDRRNRSTSNDIAYLCYYCMKNPLFRSIVKTTQYICNIFNDNTKLKRQIKWENTNKLLFSMKEYCLGIKTGVTNSAGPCMASYFKKQNFVLIIVILKTGSIWDRFREVQFLWRWGLQKFNKRMNLDEQNEMQEMLKSILKYEQIQNI